MLLSVIVPCYNEGKVIELTHNEIRKVLDEDAARSNYEYEVIYVNDGSKDNTIDIIEEFSKKDSHSKYISFSRNFGKESATSDAMSIFPRPARRSKRTPCRRPATSTTTTD